MLPGLDEKLIVLATTLGFYKLKLYTLNILNIKQ